MGYDRWVILLLKSGPDIYRGAGSCRHVNFLRATWFLLINHRIGGKIYCVFAVSNLERMSHMFNNVLVSVIGSSQCEKALTLAVNICKPSSIINIVCVLDSAHTDLGEPASGGGVALNEQKAADTLISEYCNRISCKGFQCIGKVLSGDIASELGTYAASLGSEIIVMGHQHITLLERWFGVSVAAEILGAAPCPVLVEVR